MPPATTSLSKKTFYQITTSKCKTKAIQTDLGTFKQNQAYPGITQV